MSSEGVRTENLKQSNPVVQKKEGDVYCVKFLKYTITTKSPLVVFHELKEIFERQIYSFNSETPSPIIVDAGAYVGIATLFFKWKYPDSKIIAFEPDPLNFEMLKRNITENSLDNVTLVNAALYDKESQLPFTQDGSRGAIDLKGGKQLVRTVRLSRYICQPVDFLKINIEGSEWIVLSEISEKLHLIKELVIEYHGAPELEQTFHRILELLAYKGFRYYVRDFEDKTNSVIEPPFSLDGERRFFWLIYARNLNVDKE